MVLNLLPLLYHIFFLDRSFCFLLLLFLLLLLFFFYFLCYVQRRSRPCWRWTGHVQKPSTSARLSTAHRCTRRSTEPHTRPARPHVPPTYLSGSMDSDSNLLTRSVGARSPHDPLDVHCAVKACHGIHGKHRIAALPPGVALADVPLL